MHRLGSCGLETGDARIGSTAVAIGITFPWVSPRARTARAVGRNLESTIRQAQNGLDSDVAKTWI